MVSLRPIVADDAPAIAAAVAETREELSRWMAWYRADYDAATATHWIEHSLAEAGAGSAAQFAIVDEGGDLVGVIGFEDISAQSGRAMIGYWLSARAAGRGIGRQAIQLALAWARTQPGLRLVWATVAEGNRASRRVLEVNQFRFVESRGVDERGDVALLYELELHAPAA